MFDMNKLTDAIPEDMKEKLKESAMEKLGLSKAENAKGSEASAARPEDTVDLASSHPSDEEVHVTSRATPRDAQEDAQADDSVQPESTDEYKDEEKEDAA